jgi:ectoine hydroxylase-related dioxygenase (phytanoyl-CoA dioxygenase family)
MDTAELERIRPRKVRELRYNTERQRFFQERGWVCVDNVLTRAEVKEAREELQRIMDGAFSAAYTPGKSSVAYQKDADYARVAHKTLDPSRYSEVFRRIVTSPKISAIVREVTKLPSIRLFGDQVIVKAPESDGGLGGGFHQDLPFYPIDRGGGATMWIALDDLPAEAGTLRFIEGSHRWGPIGRRIGLKGWLAEHPEDEELTTEPLALQGGMATIHDHLTLHGTYPNKWDRPRVGYMITFMPANARFNGMPSRWTDGLGLEIDGLFDHEYFPVIE